MKNRNKPLRNNKKPAGPSRPSSPAVERAKEEEFVSVSITEEFRLQTPWDRRPLGQPRRHIDRLQEPSGREESGWPRGRAAQSSLALWRRCDSVVREGEWWNWSGIRIAGILGSEPSWLLPYPGSVSFQEKEVLAGSSHTDSLVGGVPYRCTRLVHRHQLSHRSLLLLLLLGGTGLARWVRHLGHGGRRRETIGHLGQVSKSVHFGPQGPALVRARGRTP